MSTNVKCGSCGGVVEAKPVDTSQIPAGSLQPVANACTCVQPASSKTSLTQSMNCPTQCPPACPPVSCVTPCEEDHCATTIINNYATTIKSTSSFNVPNIGGTVEVSFANVSSLIPGQIVWNQGVGRLYVNDWNPVSRKAILTNLGDSCSDNALSPGELVPSCTEFAAGPPECDNGVGGGGATTGPFLSADFIAPGNGACSTAKVTTIIGLALNDIVSVAGFLYRIDQIPDTETLVLCDDGDGAPIGTTVDWDPNGDTFPDVPVIPVSGDSPCAKTPVNCGQIVVCDDTGQQTTLGGAVTGQVPTWDQDQGKYVLTTLNLSDQCTFLTACFNVDIGDDGPYLIQVDDSSIFSVSDQLTIDGDDFTIDSIPDPTHIRIIPVITPPAIKLYEELEQVCLRNCCEYLPEKVQDICDTIEDPCFHDGALISVSSPLINIVDAYVPPGQDLIADLPLTSRYYSNPKNDTAPFILSHTNATECQQYLELNLEVLQSLVSSEPDVSASMELQIGTDSDTTSLLPRVVQFFDKDNQSAILGAGTPPLGFFQAPIPDGSGWNWMPVKTGSATRREIVAPGGTVNFHLRHHILFHHGPSNPNQPPGTIGYYLFIHGALKVYRKLP